MQMLLVANLVSFPPLHLLLVLLKPSDTDRANANLYIY